MKGLLGNANKVCVYVCMYISVLKRLRMHIPTYAGLLRVSVSLVLCTATRFLQNIFDGTKVGFEANFYSLPLLVSSLTSTLL